jgi:acetoin utilization protein AcuB
MVEHEVRHVPVKDGDTLVGILTDRDLKRALDPDLGLPPKAELFVKDVFHADAFVVELHEPLDEVLHQMVARHIGSALVTKNGRLVGIFTAMDACRVFAQLLRSFFPPKTGGDAA